MKNETLTILSKKARGVVESLGWQIYHTPENLTLFLVGEAAELGEFCQWSSREEILASPVLETVKEEIADVIKSVLYLANVLSIPVKLEVLLNAKIQLDEQAYPIDDFLGVHRYRRRASERRKELTPMLPTELHVQNQPLAELQSLAWQFVTDRKSCRSCRCWRPRQQQANTSGFPMRRVVGEDANNGEKNFPNLPQKPFYLHKKQVQP